MNNETASSKHERLWLVAFFGFILLLTVIAVYSLWGFSTIEERFLAKTSGGKPLPSLTSLFFHYRIGFLLLPLPWLAYALYRTVRGKASPRQLIAFSSSLIFTLAAVSLVAALAFSMPWVEILGSSGGIYRLKPDQLAHTLFAAERKDADANYRLSRHYGFSTQRDLAEHYLQQAAALGHSNAVSSLQARKAASATPKQSAD